VPEESVVKIMEERFAKTEKALADIAAAIETLPCSGTMASIINNEFDWREDEAVKSYQLQRARRGRRDITKPDSDSDE
jgi:hypothetical protein